MNGKVMTFLAGVLTAFLLDPDAGHARRQKVGQWLDPWRRRLLRLGDAVASEARTNEAAEPLRQAAAGTADSARNLAHSAADSARRAAGAAVGSAKSKAGSAADTAKHAANEAAGSVKEAVGSVAENVRHTAGQAATTLKEAAVTPIESVLDRTGLKRTPDDSANGHAASITPEDAAGETEATATPSAADLAPRAVPDPIPEGEPNDPTLTARVESELFRSPEVPKDKINVDSAFGIVTLRGTVNEGEAKALVEMTRAIDGVSDVVSLLREE
jgi:osmotically-inducible protein OsmY